MRTVLIALALVACSDAGDRAAKEAEAEAKKKAAEAPKPEPKPVEEKKPEPVVEKKDKPPPDPEPTTPEEIEKARKKAIIELRSKDALRFCGMSKLDEKSDPQALLGCALAACREKDGAHAKEWSKPLEAPKLSMMKKQVVGMCRATGTAM